MRSAKNYLGASIILLTILFATVLPVIGGANEPMSADTYKAHPFFIIGETKSFSSVPLGYSPSQIKSFYNLPQTGGSGTIAIIDAFYSPTIQNDLTVFCNQFNLPSASLEIHNMSSTISVDSGWALETSLDVEWAHAIAPNAHILLVEATSDELSDLFNAVSYAAGRSDVTSISMSWGLP